MLSRCLIFRFTLATICAAAAARPTQAGEPSLSSAPTSASSTTKALPHSNRGAGVNAPAAERGYRRLTTKAYLPADFDDEVFSNIWEVWEAAAREKAAKATPAQRRWMAFARYGLTALPSGSPAQYVVDGQGQWTMNCFACHQGRIAGQTISGLPNSTFALATLTEEVRATKLRMEKPLSRMDIGSLYMPLGHTRGTTNAVMFGVVLMNFRDAELNVHTDRGPPPMVHHDLDAPPWWNYRTKKQLYYDGFVPKGHRALMQFLMVRENGPEKFREWEDDYRDIEAWIEALRPPKYPFAIDRELAAAGRPIFNQHCASCHGTYGDEGAVANYPGRVVSIAKVGTDPVRLRALTPVHRSSYAASWFNEFGRQPVATEPAGYVAPPLSGIWASAPYLHNGSVPTLWHLLHAEARPAVWRRLPEGREQEIEGYDQKKVGVAIDSFQELPEQARSLRQRREYFDTRQPGKSAAGHTFPETLAEDEKRAVLEYLKTL